MNAPVPIRYHLAEDTIDKGDIDALIRWLGTYPRLTKDRLTLQFEAEWSRRFGCRYSVFCNSGSSANLLMVYALLTSGRLRNRKIVLPAVGWATTVAPAIQFGMEPILCEADPDTFGLDLHHLEALLKDHQPGAVMMVQVLGVPHKMPALQALREQYGFFLLEDACAAVGASAYGRKVGTFGEMGSFSLYFGHQLSTIEGGMVCTDDKRFYDLILMLRSHGWGKDLDEETRQRLVSEHGIDDFHSPFVFYEPGFNLRSTDLNAFLGLRQLEDLDRIVNRRAENHARYLDHLGGRFYVQRAEDPNARICSISFGLLAASVEARRTIVSELIAHGIETRLFSAGNLGLHPFWTKRFGPANFPMADRIHHTGFFLPNHPSLTLKEVDFISQVVLDAACPETVCAAAGRTT